MRIMSENNITGNVLSRAMDAKGNKSRAMHVANATANNSSGGKRIIENSPV